MYRGLRDDLWMREILRRIEVWSLLHHSVNSEVTRLESNSQQTKETNVISEMLATDHRGRRQLIEEQKLDKETSDTGWPEFERQSRDPPRGPTLPELPEEGW
ncbi:hypothetical protein Tco_0461978 [Tanacetum coccineum]